jgi:hypothetical protein
LCDPTESTRYCVEAWPAASRGLGSFRRWRGVFEGDHLEAQDEASACFFHQYHHPAPPHLNLGCARSTSATGTHLIITPTGCGQVYPPAPNTGCGEGARLRGGLWPGQWWWPRCSIRPAPRSAYVARGRSATRMSSRPRFITRPSSRCSKWERAQYEVPRHGLLQVGLVRPGDRRRRNN